MKLLGARTITVRYWLAAHDFVPATTPVKAYGKTKSVAPNTSPDGKDDPVGRQKNRRVEIVFARC